MKSNIAELIETGEMPSLYNIFSGAYSTSKQKKKKKPVKRRTSYVNKIKYFFDLLSNHVIRQNDCLFALCGLILAIIGPSSN